MLVPTRLVRLLATIHTLIETSSAAAPSSAPVLSLSLQLRHFKAEKLFLVLGNVSEQHITVAKIDLTLLRQVAIQARQRVFVHSHDGIQGAFSDLQGRQMRQEIITDEEAEKHEVVHQVLKIELKRQPQVLELQIEVLSDDGYLDKLELSDPRQSCLVLGMPQTALAGNVARLSALETLALVR